MSKAAGQCRRDNHECNARRSSSMLGHRALASQHANAEPAAGQSVGCVRAGVARRSYSFDRVGIESFNINILPGPAGHVDHADHVPRARHSLILISLRGHGGIVSQRKNATSEAGHVPGGAHHMVARLTISSRPLWRCHPGPLFRDSRSANDVPSTMIAVPTAPIRLAKTVALSSGHLPSTARRQAVMHPIMVMRRAPHSGRTTVVDRVYLPEKRRAVRSAMPMAILPVAPFQFAAIHYSTTKVVMPRATGHSENDNHVQFAGCAFFVSTSPCVLSSGGLSRPAVGPGLLFTRRGIADRANSAAFCGCRPRYPAADRAGQLTMVPSVVSPRTSYARTQDHENHGCIAGHRGRPAGTDNLTLVPTAQFRTDQWACANLLPIVGSSRRAYGVRHPGKDARLTLSLGQSVVLIETCLPSPRPAIDLSLPTLSMPVAPFRLAMSETMPTRVLPDNDRDGIASITEVCVPGHPFSFGTMLVITIPSIPNDAAGHCVHDARSSCARRNPFDPAAPPFVAKRKCRIGERQMTLSPCQPFLSPSSSRSSLRLLPIIS